MFSNRTITDIVNYSQSNSKAIVTFTFSSDENLLKLKDAIKELIKRLNGKLPDAISKLQYKGVEEYKDSKLVLKLTEAKILFDERNIKIK